MVMQVRLLTQGSEAFAGFGFARPAIRMPLWEEMLVVCIYAFAKNLSISCQK
jgi:hypothetical protein